MVSESFLNGLAETGIGDGVDVDPLIRTFQLPLMGPMELVIDMTIVGVTFVMDPANDGRLLATIRATGTVEATGDSPMPILPGVARVRGDVLVDPIIELRDDHSFVAILDVLNSELVDMELEGIEGLDADGEAQEQMSRMLFDALGGELFRGLAEKLGSIGLELGPEQGEAVADLGVATGPAEVRVEKGHVTVGLLATPGLVGSASPVEVGGGRIGVGLASGSLAVLVEHLSRERLGMGLPFDLDLDTRERRLDGRIRNYRLGDSLPDLRPGLRYTIRPRLVDGQVELTLREAWVELPDVIPTFTQPINRLNRWIGGVASRAPLTVRVPSRVSLPVRPGSTATMRASIVDLSVGADGVHVTVDAAL